MHHQGRGQTGERLPPAAGEAGARPAERVLDRLGRQTGPYGPYAFGLSGHSPTLRSFAGGDAQLGLHGTDQPRLLGRSVSHGCIRIANDVVRRLAGLLPLGTPVVVQA